MAAHNKGERIVAVFSIIDDFLESSSSSDDDEVMTQFCKLPMAIPKIKNYLDVVFSMNDKTVSLAIKILFEQVIKVYYYSSLKATFEYRGKLTQHCKMISKNLNSFPKI